MFRLLALFCLMLILRAVPAYSHDNKDDLHIALTAAFVSEEGIDVYEDMVKYIQKKTGYEAELTYGVSYTVVDKMLEAGKIDVAFVCGYPYVLSQLKEEPTTHLMAAPIMKSATYKNQPIYYSYIIANKNSLAESLEDMQGKRLVYNDILSNSRYNMLRARLIDTGHIENFFSDIMVSGSHEASIRMVSENAADVSAVDSLVFDYALANNNAHALNVKIIDKIGPAGAPPVVYSKFMPEEKRQKVKKALLEMHENPEGRAILDKGLLQRFEPVTDSNYDNIRAMHDKAEQHGYMEIK